MVARPRGTRAPPDPLLAVGSDWGAERLPYSEGEYDSYAPRVLAALQQRASVRGIAALLATIEGSKIGVGSGDHESTAQLIVDWYAKSRSYWCEFEREH